MKDSGISWVGKIPTHWTKKKGKYILRYMSKPVKQDDSVITCFRDGEVTLRSNRREDGFTMADKEIGYQGLCSIGRTKTKSGRAETDKPN